MILDLIVQADLHVVFHAQLVEEADVLKGTGDTGPVDLDGVHAVGVLAVHHDGAAGGLIDLGQQVENGGLARAVGADETGDLGAAHGEVEVVDGGEAAEVDAQMAAFQNGRFVHVALRHDGMAGDGDHFGLFSAFQSAHFAASFFMLRDGPSSSFSLRKIRIKKDRMAGLLVASMTRMSTMA